MTQANRVTVISVAYNSVEVLRPMLASLPDNVARVVVDNSPEKSTELVSLAQETGTQLISNATNNGFGAACNQGAEWAQTEFLFFLNPDASLLPDTVDRLLAAAQKYPQASAFLPRVENASGKPDIKRRSNLVARSEYMDRGWPEDGTEVRVASGAALFVRRSAFEKIGGFDPDIFLYHEDDDLTLRLIRDCGPIVFVTAAGVQHLGGESSARNAAIARLKAWHMGRSQVYTMAKHGRPLPFVRALVAAIGHVLLPVNWFSARKRAKRIGMLKGILSTRADGGAGFKEVQ